MVSIYRQREMMLFVDPKYQFLTIYHQAEEAFIYFITVRIIFQGERTKIVSEYFVDFSFFFVRTGIVKQLFNFFVTGFCKKKLVRAYIDQLKVFQNI